MTKDEILSAMEEIIQSIERSAEYVPATALGLDPRSGHVYVGEDFIAATHIAGIEYYGGFEYVDKDYVFSLGVMRIYTDDDDRVRGHLERYRGNQQEETEDD